MRTSELINQLLQMTIPNEMMREIIQESIALHSHSNDPIVILQDAESDESHPLSGAGSAIYLPDTSWRGSVIGTDELEDYDPMSVVPCIALWSK